MQKQKGNSSLQNRNIGNYPVHKTEPDRYKQVRVEAHDSPENEKRVKVEGHSLFCYNKSVLVFEGFPSEGEKYVKDRDRI